MKTNNIKTRHTFTVYNAVVQFQIYTGMRIGETPALTWIDINIQNLYLLRMMANISIVTTLIIVLLQ